eukprot:scaffold8603_cov248-Pinguiococcus_pyrenoidosus.AAC.1
MENPRTVTRQSRSKRKSHLEASSRTKRAALVVVTNGAVRVSEAAALEGVDASAVSRRASDLMDKGFDADFFSVAGNLHATLEAVGGG